jgi:chromosome segregation ATPase
MQVLDGVEIEVKNSKDSRVTLLENVCTLKHLTRCKVDQKLDQSEKAAQVLMKNIEKQKKEVEKMEFKFSAMSDALNAESQDDMATIQKFQEILPACDAEIERVNAEYLALKENEKLIMEKLSENDKSQSEVASLTSDIAQQEEEFVALNNELNLLKTESEDLVAEMAEIEKSCEEEKTLINSVEAQCKELEELQADSAHLVSFLSNFLDIHFHGFFTERSYYELGS